MEHLMSAKERGERQAEIRDVPTIPWLGFDHDEGYHPLTTIREYPISRKWTREELRELEFGNLQYRSATEALAMIQSWMFFGLLESAFNTSFKTESFLRPTTDGRRVVHTAYLRKWIDDYHANFNLSPSNHSLQRQAQQDRLVDSVNYAAFWNQRLVDMEKERPTLLTNSELFGPVTRLITLIAEAVWTVAQQFPYLERFFINCDWSISQVNHIALRRRLKARGWCPSLFDNVKNLSRTPSSFLEYVSLVPPLGDTTSQHQQCSLDKCVEHNIDESVYRTKHRMDGCHCEMIRPPLSDVNDALRDWTIPVMSGSSLLKLDSAPIVQAHSPDRPLEFVAFSHVWSDGLGSTTEAGIPKCQVEFLMETSLRAAGTPLFWIDSLCIPKIRDTRKLAISMMSETYRSASATVVLDRKIKRCDFKRSLETRIVALSLSTWQERLWTLPESSLSKRVIFMFESDLVLAETIIKESGPKIYRPVVRTGHLLLDNLTNWVNDDQVTVGGLQRNLYRRTSSKPDDECLAVAPFLNVDVSPLLAVEGEERMIRFWDKVKFVPRAIVLCNTPKISRDGYRWAPRSLMNQKDSITLSLKDRSATVTEFGLRGTYWMYELRTQSQVPLQMDIIFYDSLSDCCLRLLEHSTTSNISLSTKHVVIFEDRPIPSMNTYLAAILLKVSDGRSGDPHQMPTYRYEGLTGANVFSKAVLGDFPEAELMWSHVKQSARGQFTGESAKSAEVLIR